MQGSSTHELEARTRAFWEISLQWNNRATPCRGQEITTSDAIHDLRFFSESSAPGRPLIPQAKKLLSNVIMGYNNPSSVPAKVHQLRRGLIA